MEFFAVITSPRRVTTPCSPEEARAEVEKYTRANRPQKIYTYNQQHFTRFAGIEVLTP
jgi:hypothetical protein